MKKYVLSLMLVVTAMFVFPFHSYAQNIPDEEEGTEVRIEEYTSENGAGRSIVPLTVTLYQSLSCIEVAFLSNIGEVTIQLTNLSINASVNTVIDSNFGSCIIPVTNGSGIYRIEFITMEGTQFYGLFILL